MKDQVYSVNDFGSNKTDTTQEEQKQQQKPLWKKYLIPIIIIISIIIITIILILTFVLKTSENKDNKEEVKLIYGTIKCIYDIQTSHSNILGEEFKKEIELDILIDNETSKYSKEYTFQTLGKHLFQYKLYNKNINMDYMFKNVSSLINVELISENQIKIQSMISTFENCINLNNFESVNFSASSVKSFHKLFYNTILSSFKIDRII